MNHREIECVQPFVHDIKEGINVQYNKRMLCQFVYGIFSAVHKYYTAQNVLSPEERATYGNIDNHPDEIKILFLYWVQSGGAERFDTEHSWEEFSAGNDSGVLLSLFLE